MCDIETTGTNSERNGIIQIAAVKFNYLTGEVSDDFFDRCLILHPGREWDFDTRQWWQKQGDVLNQIQSRGENAHLVMHDFYHWLLKDYPDTNEGLQFWGKPTHFDYTFITSYLNMFGFKNPCHFRYARDLNSFMAGLMGSPEHPDVEVEFQGDAHNALYDTIHQIKLLFAAKQQTVQSQVIFQ